MGYGKYVETRGNRTIGARGRTRTGTAYGQRILSPLRLPIPPPGQRDRGASSPPSRIRAVRPRYIIELEAEVGIEPAYTALQAAA